jgi:hypothetical protein
MTEPEKPKQDKKPRRFSSAALLNPAAIVTTLVVSAALDRKFPRFVGD